MSEIGLTKIQFSSVARMKLIRLNSGQAPRNTGVTEKHITTGMKHYFTITAIPAFQDNYIWLLVNADRLAIIIDPGDAAPVIAAVNEQQLTPVAILITHHHFDHCNGVKELSENYSLKIFGPAKEKISGINQPLNESENISQYGLFANLTVMDIPGHTLGHIAYYGEGILFCGDTLFTAGCGKLFEGTAEQMFNSLAKIAALPAETKIYCGHEYTLANLLFAQMVESTNIQIQQRLNQTQILRKQNLPTVPSTLAEEKATNPFLRCHIPEVINAVEKYAGCKLEDPVEFFAKLRQWKDEVKTGYVF